MALNEDIQKILEEDVKTSSINLAVSMVLSEKLDNLILKIKDVKKEIERTFENTVVLDSDKELIDQIKNKYNEIYSLINAATKNIDEISNKLK